MNENDWEKYADIIDLPHHQSVKRPHMPLEDRAAQFSPFAALTGYEDAVRETARLTQQRIELDEYSKEEVNRQINYIQESLKESKGATKEQYAITYFQPDLLKDGGAYVTVTGAVKKVKEYEQVLVMEDGTEVPLAEVGAIVGE